MHVAAQVFDVDGKSQQVIEQKTEIGILDLW